MKYIRQVDFPAYERVFYDITAFACDSKANRFALKTANLLEIYDEKGPNNITKTDNFMVRALAFDPKGEFLAAGTYSKEVMIFETVTLKHIHTFNSKHTEIVITLAYSPDGKYLASGSRDYYRTVKIWDMQTKKCIQTFASSNGSQIYDMFALVFNLDGSLLMVSPTDIKIYKKMYFDLLSKAPNSQVIQNKINRVTRIENSCVIS